MGPRKCAALLATLVFSCVLPPVALEGAQIVEPPPPGPRPEFRHLSRAVMGLLQEYASPTLRLKAELGAQVLKQYLDEWDPDRKLLTRRNFEAAMRRRGAISDDLKKGELDLPFVLFRLIKSRMEMRAAHSLRLLEQGLDFGRDEVLKIGRRDMGWALNQSVLKERWRKYVKNDVIELRLEGRTPAEIAQILERRYVRDYDRIRHVEADEIVDRWLNAYISAIDRHGAYFSPRVFESLEIQGKGFLDGIGVVLASKDQYPVIERVIPGSPAAQSGNIHSGDRIVWIKERRGSPFSYVRGWPLREVVKKLRGPKKSVVELHILPAGPQAILRKVRLIRDRFILRERTATARLVEARGSGGVRTVGVIEIPTFHAGAGSGRSKIYRGTSGHVRMLIRKLRATGIDGLVLDLRRNTGGAILEAARTAGLFINDGPIVQILSHKGKKHVYKDPSSGIEWPGPLSVLVGPKSASAAEIVAAAIQDYRRGIIIGERTFGKGTVQKIIRLDDFRKGAALKVTSSRWYRVTGDSVEGRGVYPDVDLTWTFGSGRAEMPRRRNGKLDAIGAARWEPHRLRKGRIAIIRNNSRKRMETSPVAKVLRQESDERARTRTDRPLTLHLERRWAEHYRRERMRIRRIEMLREALDSDRELRNVKELSKFRNTLILREAIQITLDLGTERNLHR